MRIVVLVALLVSAAANVSAQSLYGTLVGNVTDETGAALPGASVKVTQTETNLSRDVATNESGGYTVPNLLPGTYEVAVTLQGFKSYTARGIAVRPDLSSASMRDWASARWRSRSSSLAPRLSFKRKAPLCNR